MRGFHKSLFRIAADTAKAARDQANRLEKEILDAENRKAKAEAALKLAHSSVHRLDAFQSEIGGKVQCPICWVRDGVRSEMVPISSPTDTDLFRCKTCHTECPLELSQGKRAPDGKRLRHTVEG